MPRHSPHLVLRTLLIAIWLLGGGPAAADVDDLHVGVNLRTDLGTRQARLDAGLRTGRLDWIVVVDPIGLVGGQQDYDALAAYRLERLSGWSAFLGHRTTVFAIQGGHALHEKVLAGVGARLPGLFGQRVRGEWGAEVAVNWLRHGGDLPSDWLSLASGRHFADLINGSFFVRFEHAWAM